MKPSAFSLLPRFFIVVITIAGGLRNVSAQDKAAAILKVHQYDLAGNGHEFLLSEARSSSFFLMGELHGSTEGKFIREASINHKSPLIWGCDMEEISMDGMISDLKRRNLTNKAPFQKSIVTALTIDSMRKFGDSKIKARLLREDLMKESFTNYYNNLPKGAPQKVLFRFGRNHLHRGYDGRGISTLGNFVSELAVYKGLKTFNVAMFAAGGQCRLMHETFDADERADDPAFQFLWEQAASDATVFDLRPLRVELHGIQSGSLSDLQKRLLYWANSYDAIICFKKVTPIQNR